MKKSALSGNLHLLVRVFYFCCIKELLFLISSLHCFVGRFHSCFLPVRWLTPIQLGKAEGFDLEESFGVGVSFFLSSNSSLLQNHFLPERYKLKLSCIFRPLRLRNYTFRIVCSHFCSLLLFQHSLSSSPTSLVPRISCHPMTLVLSSFIYTHSRIIPLPADLGKFLLPIYEIDLCYKYIFALFFPTLFSLFS